MLRFNVDVNDVETGDETSKGWLTLDEVFALIRKGQEGDDIVVHCLGNQDSDGI
jgi:hypothetical protein